MSGRGLTRKTKLELTITLERAMLTRHYLLTLELDRCVGCQIGPIACPKGAITLVEARIENGRLAQRPSVDIDPEKCVLCGICEIICPKKAIKLTINKKRENPVLTHEAFPELTRSASINQELFDLEAFDPGRRDFIMKNCPVEAISCDEEKGRMLIDEERCIHCRQCEIASNGAFTVQQPWEGQVQLRREKCLKDCLACADICPTRALHIEPYSPATEGHCRRADEGGELVLADYYCIKCGACMQVCPIRAVYEEHESPLEWPGVARKITQKRITNADSLPLLVERWRVRHTPVKSAAWIEALTKMADDKAGMVEIDRKRALKRRDLLKALPGYKAGEQHQ